jgi:hypothetical protein
MTARVSVADPKDVVLSALAQIKNGDDGDTETADGGDEPR